MSSYTNYNIYNKKQYFNKIRALNSQKKKNMISTWGIISKMYLMEIQI